MISTIGWILAAVFFILWIAAREQCRVTGEHLLRAIAAGRALTSDYHHCMTERAALDAQLAEIRAGYPPRTRTI